MTVYRRILKVKTVGSRSSGDLRPAFTDGFGNNFPGVHFSVLEYDEPAAVCILEAWCSDNPAQPKGGTQNETALSRVAQHPSVLSTLSTHPNSPTTLGNIFAIAPGSVDEVGKTLTVQGNAGTYIRKETIQTEQGPLARYILDEG